MAFEILFLILLPALFISAAVWDLASFTIPNFLSLALLALFILFVGSAGLSGDGLTWSEAGLHLLAGTIGLAAGMALFAAGVIGGGDAKLFAVACLWLGINMMFEYTVLASIFGGVLTLGLLFMRRMPLPTAMMKYEWFVRLADRKAGIPYGVALAAAALMVLPQTELFIFVMGG